VRLRRENRRENRRATVRRRRRFRNRCAHWNRVAPALAV